MGGDLKILYTGVLTENDSSLAKVRYLPDEVARTWIAASGHDAQVAKIIEREQSKLTEVRG